MNQTSIKFVTVCILNFLRFGSSFAQDVDNRYFPKEALIADHFPAKQNLWIFLMAGQSNMAGRGFVEPQDTLPEPRILAINQKNEIVIAKEPLHFYEPTRTGLDCGLSFAKTLLKALPDSISLLLVPAAVGGSSIQQWLGDSTWRDVKLLTNTKQKIGIVANLGIFKGVLWHQGEANANTINDIEQHSARLTALVDTFRTITRTKNLPFLLAELGSFSKTPELFEQLDQQLLAFNKSDKNSAVIKTGDLTHKGDFIHFSSEAQRLMGERFAEAFILQFLPGNRK